MSIRFVNSLRAANVALRNGVTLDDVLAKVPEFRQRHPDTPIVIFTYYNVVRRGQSPRGVMVL